MSTYTPRIGDITHRWCVLDARNMVLGRLATVAASLLSGKYKPTFTPNIDDGDFVIVINSAQVYINNNKLTNKFVYRHSGYPGGLHKKSIGKLLKQCPNRVIENAIVGMLPHTKLGRSMRKKLRIYSGPEHPHLAQQPIKYQIKQVKQ